MEYTIRFTHLANIPNFEIWRTIKRYDWIGRMGNSGSSSAPHVHTDCVECYHSEVYHLIDLEKGILKPAPRQLNYFIDNELFGTEILITTYYNDPEYMKTLKKLHQAYDVVPENRHETRNNFDIFWNRSATGIVLSKGFDKGYGNYIHIGFEV